ncbi:superoxide dismutase family protein [Porphyrobacter sp. GA68]|uniref:superoxide dismutase family protein n=1 Tax=Porphyrobacter sp. GA68 TaxID=2883480 RepID=UPI001D190648|nr:superoxide dismutase family protein [Porphyrobacter sp. GA68]
MLRTAAALVSAMALGACTTAGMNNQTPLGTADLRFADGRSAGTATLMRSGETLLMQVSVSGVPSGSRAIHLHTTGQCTAPDFESAGPHLNPFGRQHGLADPAGPHLGDLPNLNVRASGVTTARMEIADNAARALPNIFDADGTAVIIHAQADDNVTDPAGNAGSRIVCGVLRRS